MAKTPQKPSPAQVIADSIANADLGTQDTTYIGIPNDWDTGGYLIRDSDGVLRRVTGIPGSKKQIKLEYYKTGHEGVPAVWSIERRAEMQRRLVNIGLLEPGSFAPSRWDAATAAAFKLLLTEANRAGTSYGLILEEYEGLAAQGLLGPSSAAKRQIQLTSDTDLKEALRDAPSLIGRQLTSKEESDLVSEFHSLERSAQSETASTVSAAPTFESFVKDKLRTRLPDEYHGTQIGERFEEFTQLLTQSQRGGMSE